MKPRVLIVIPAYNEEKSIAAILLALRREVPEFDRVVINDGSQDKTAEVVRTLGEKQLNLVQNLGYGHALQTGLKYALLKQYEIVVSIDADGQHRPSDVKRLVAALESEQADMVIGSRFVKDSTYDTPLDRRLGQLLFSHLTQLLLGQRIFDTSSGFKALRARSCAVIVDTAFLDFHIESMVQLRLRDHKIVEIPVVVEERQFGQSMHSLRSIFNYPLKTILLTVVAFMDAIIFRRAK